MREKLKELSEILKTNPAIKERLERLEFGCWIYWNGEYTIFLSKEGIQMGGGYTGFRILRDFSFTQYIGKARMQIIGHTPQFNDVLEYLGEDYYIDRYGICKDIGYSVYELVYQVMLSTGPLSDQSDETLDEIILLLNSLSPNELERKTTT